MPPRMNVNSFAIVTILSGFLGGQCGHQFDDSLLSLGRHALDFFGVRAPGIGPEADPVIEEDFFEGPGFIGFVGGSGELLPGIIGFGIPDPENEAVTIPVDELKTFEEAGACGTAAVISPIGSIYDIDTEEYIEYGKEVGPVCLKLYNALRDIQYGRAEDLHGWCTIVE